MRKPSSEEEDVQIAPNTAKVIKLCGGPSIISRSLGLRALVILGGKWFNKIWTKRSPICVSPTKPAKENKNTKKGNIYNLKKEIIYIFMCVKDKNLIFFHKIIWCKDHYQKKFQSFFFHTHENKN